IAGVSTVPDRDLRDALAQLVAAELIFQRGSPPEATYIFKHALVQDAAYASLLRSRRQQLHAKIAQVLTRQFTGTTYALPEILARHYSSAGLTEQAVESWRLAGERAVSRSAFEEAIAHFTNCLNEIGQLTEGRKRQELEVDLRLGLAGALAVTKG